MSQQNGLRLCLLGFIILVLGLLGHGPLARGADLGCDLKGRSQGLSERVFIPPCSKVVSNYNF